MNAKIFNTLISMKILAIIAILTIAGCIDPICNCAMDLRFSIKIQDGGDSTCIQSAEIIINNGNYIPTTRYDSNLCTYSLNAPDQIVDIKIKKIDYDSIKIDSLNVRLKKIIEIKWYKATLGTNPEIIIR